MAKLKVYESTKELQTNAQQLLDRVKNTLSQVESHMREVQTAEQHFHEIAVKEEALAYENAGFDDDTPIEEVQPVQAVDTIEAVVVGDAESAPIMEAAADVVELPQ